MFGLEGLWLVGALAAVYLVGVFTSQYAKDKLTGVPSDLRKALSTLETAAKNEISTAKAKVVAQTAGLLVKGKAAAVAEVAKLDPVPAAAPVATVRIDTAPAASAAPAAG